MSFCMVFCREKFLSKIESAEMRRRVNILRGKSNEVTVSIIGFDFRGHKIYYLWKLKNLDCCFVLIFCFLITIIGKLCQVLEGARGY